MPIRLLFWTLLITIAALAFMPSYDPLPKIVSASDIFNHFAAFFTLALIYRFAYPQHASKHLFVSLLAFGMLIECVQYFLPTRSASLKDLAVDASAVAAAVLFHYFRYRFEQTRLNRI